MASARLNQVRKSFDFLLREHGFVVAQEHYDARDFGNVLVLFTSPDHLLKVIIDRGEAYVEIAATQRPEAYFDLAILLDYLAEKEWSYDFTMDTNTQLEALAAIVKSFSSQILQDKLVRNHRRELEEIVQRRLQERWNRFMH